MYIKCVQGVHFAFYGVYICLDNGVYMVLRLAK